MEVLSNIDLPTPPQTAMKLVQLCSDPNADLNDIINVVQVDGALSAKLLRAANSAYYGQQYEVSTLRRAAVVLGLGTVKIMALSFHLADQASQWSDVTIDMTAHWQGNLLRACLARQGAINARVLPAKCPDEAFLVGLLQDFVVPVINRTVGERYGSFLGLDGLYTTPRTVAMEEEAVETNHAHLVGRLFDIWRFAPTLTFAVTNHHVRPDTIPASDRAMALWQWAYWVGAINFNEDRQTAPIADEMRKMAQVAFGLDGDLLGMAFYRAIEDYEVMKDFFGSILPKNCNGGAILENARALIMEIDQQS